MENLLSTTIPTISGTGPIPPFPPLTGWRFDPNSADAVELVDELLKRNISFPDGVTAVFNQLTCVEEYGGGVFPPNTFKEKKAIISYPKSGTEWIKALFLSAFGMFIHKYVYTPLPSSNPHLYSISTCDCYMLQKDHDNSIGNPLKKSRIEYYNNEAIVLIRNPFLSILQTRYFNYRYENRKANGNNGSIADRYVEKSLFIENKGWGTFVEKQLEVWENLYTLWIKGVKRGGIIYYERFEADPETELLRLGGLIGLTWIDKNRLDCAINRGRPNFNVLLDQQVFPYSNDLYSPAQKLQISGVIDRVQLLLMEYGFDPLPTEMYEFYEPTDLLGEDQCDPQ